MVNVQRKRFILLHEREFFRRASVSSQASSTRDPRLKAEYARRSNWVRGVQTRFS